MRASTLEALDPALLQREVPKPLGLIGRSIIWFPPLLMPWFGPRWFANPLLLCTLSLYLILHLFHHSGLLYQRSKVLDGQWGYHQTNVPTEVVLKPMASPFFIEWQGVEAAKMLEPLCIFSQKFGSLS